MTFLVKLMKSWLIKSYSDVATYTLSYSKYLFRIVIFLRRELANLKGKIFAFKVTGYNLSYV